MELLVSIRTRKKLKSKKLVWVKPGLRGAPPRCKRVTWCRWWRTGRSRRVWWWWSAWTRPPAAPPAAGAAPPSGTCGNAPSGLGWCWSRGNTAGGNLEKRRSKDGGDAFFPPFFNLWKEDLLKLVVVTLLHDLDYLQHFLHVLSGGDQTLQHQHLVVDEHVSIETTHHLKTCNERGQSS